MLLLNVLRADDYKTREGGKMGDITERLGAKIIEGKTKIIWELKDSEDCFDMQFKSDITAGDGAKRDMLEGKALIDWETNMRIFEYLNRNGVATHYVESPQEGHTIVKKLVQKINIEVVSRRVATGSVLKLGYTEGQRFDPLMIQFFYKDDALHDPLLDNNFIEKALVEGKKDMTFPTMHQLNDATFLLLEAAFAEYNHQLIDFKLEYGRIAAPKGGLAVVLIDEITAGSMRVWPYATGKFPDLKKDNLMSELDKSGMKDKQLYRDGQPLGVVKEGFEAILTMTKRF